MKRWLLIAAAVILLAPLVLAMEDAPGRRPDAPREGDQMRRPNPDSPEFPVMMERFGNALREQQERMNRIEEQQHRLMETMQSKPAPNPQFARGARPYHHHKGLLCLMLLGCAVVHVLVAVWVFQDIRARGAGSGLWIVIALLSGLVGALVYAVVRLGEMKKT